MFVQFALLSFKNLSYIVKVSKGREVSLWDIFCSSVYSKEPAKENILFNNPKVILTPHIAASTAEAQIIVAEMLSNQICNFLLKGIKINTV